MAKKTNCTINGKEYYRLRKTVGKRMNEQGQEVPIVKNFYGESKSDALQQYQDYMDKKKQGVDTSKQYFGIVADNWLHAFFLKDEKLASSTRDLYFSAWKKYIVPSDLYHMPLEEVSTSTLQNLYNSMGCPASSLACINKLMKRFYKYLDHEGLSRDITGALVVPSAGKKKEGKEVVVWTDEEAQAILSGFDHAQHGFRLRFLVIMAYFTGCRISELLGVRYEDFNLEEKTLSIRRQIVEEPTFSRSGATEYELKEGNLKSLASYRIIPIDDYMTAALVKHRAWHREEQLKNGYRSEYVFTTSTGGFYYRKSVSQALNRYYKKIGVPCKGIHTYRHTFGTNLCRKGVPIQTASSLLGHSDINVTAKYYISVGMDEKRRAVELLKNG